MKELKYILAFSFLLFAFFIDSFADAEWQQNGSWEYYNDDKNVVDNHDDDEQQQNGSWEYYNNYNDHEDNEDYDDNEELLQNGASIRNYNDVEAEAVDSNSWANIIDDVEEGTRTDVGGDDFNNGEHIMPEMRSAKKPNILLIMADDVGQGDIEYYWKSGLVQMPNIEMLGATGVTFYDAHSTPLCAPSRYMLLSGNYVHRGQWPGGTWGITGEQNQFLKYQKSIAEALKEGGNYSTSMYGKWHIGGKIPLTENGSLNSKHIITAGGHDWTQSLIGGPQSIGFDNSFITSQGIQKHPYSFFRDGYLTTDVSDAKLWKKKSYNTTSGTSIIMRKGEGDPAWDSTKYNQILVNETEAFLDDYLANGSTDPFFTYVALGAVHAPYSPPYTYLDGTKIAGTYKSKHMDMLFEMDKVVGSLVRMIDERDLAEDTIIIFTSDNGGIGTSHSSQYGHNSHGPFRGAKGDVYEGGTRVPMIMRYKGNFPANETRWNLVGLQDLYATICELAGVDIPDRSARDSRSFAEYIYDGKAPSPRKYQASWDHRQGSLSRSIRKGMLKLVQHLPSMKTELYNLTEDISESYNIAFYEKYKTVKRKMINKLREIGKCPGRDRKTGFELKGGYSKGKIVTCAWFKKKPWKCNEYPEGEVYCSSLCNRNC